MDLMEWNDRFILGHDKIDRDHRKLVALVNQLSEAMLKREGKEICGKVIEDLAAYAKTHFSTEEQLMALHHYANTAEHKAEHANFVDQVAELKSRFDAGSITLSISLLGFLKEWLTKHILITDKALVAGIAAS